MAARPTEGMESRIDRGTDEQIQEQLHGEGCASRDKFSETHAVCAFFYSNAQQENV